MKIVFDLMAQYKFPRNETTDETSAQPTDPTTATAGAWVRLLDCEGLEKEVYKSRRRSIRPEVQL